MFKSRDFTKKIYSKQFMALRVIWQYMDRSVTKKILYGPHHMAVYGPVHILPYDPKWHELFAILYFLSKIMQVPAGPYTTVPYTKIGCLQPTPTFWCVGPVHILPYDPKCHELFTIYFLSEVTWLEHCPINCFNRQYLETLLFWS
jgi:hypothetical protein